MSHEPHVKIILSVHIVVQFKGNVSSEYILVLKDTLHSFMLKLCLSSVIVLFSEKRNSAPKIHSKSFNFLEMIKFVHLVVWRLFESCKMNCRWHFPTIALSSNPLAVHNRRETGSYGILYFRTIDSCSNEFAAPVSIKARTALCAFSLFVKHIFAKNKDSPKLLKFTSTFLFLSLIFSFKNETVVSIYLSKGEFSGG